MSVILFDWSGTLSNFRKKDLLNGKKVINEKLTPLLQGNRIGIISNTSKNAEELINAVKNEFERVKLQVEIQVYNTLFQNGDLFRKPSPWMIWYALYKMNIQDYSKVVFVGDKESDKLAAQAARVEFIYIKNFKPPKSASKKGILKCKCKSGGKCCCGPKCKCKNCPCKK